MSRCFARGNQVELPTKGSVTFLDQGRLPIDASGTVLLPHIPTREYVGDFFKDKHITDDLLCEHFLGMLSTFLQGIASGDEQAITSTAEKNLATKVLSQNALNVQYEAPNDDAIDNVYIVDRLFLKGVNIQRALNETNLDYVQTRQLERKGIREYVHKYHLGLQPFYFKKSFEHLMKEIDS
jgi:hypothetical protein